MQRQSNNIEDNIFARANSRPLYINFDLYTEGDHEYKKELGALLIDNVRELQQSLPDSIQQHNPKLFQEMCHKVKVTLSMLEDEELTNIVKELQRDILNPHRDGSFIARSQRFQNICNLIVDSLSKEIHTA